MGVGCTTSAPSPQSTSSPTDTIVSNPISGDSVVDLKRNTIDPLESPDSLLVAIARLVDSLGHVSDTARFKQVGFYADPKRGRTQRYEGRVFYHFSDPLSEVSDWNHWNHDAGLVGLQPVDTTGGKDVVDAWGYFYRDTIAAKYVPKGAQIVWKTTSSDAAQGWLNVFRNAYPLPYFNTMPHYMVVADRVVILNAPAMYFSYDQIKMYKLLLSRLGSSSHYTNAKL